MKTVVEEATVFFIELIIMDCTFKTDEGKFNYRVGALIRDGNRILMARNSAEREGTYYSVGGRVQYGESLEEAILRELREETGLDCEVERLCAIHENFFTMTNGVPYHEFSAFFLVKMTDELRAIPSGKGTTGGPADEFLQWIDLDKLEGITIFPRFFTTTDFTKEPGVVHFVSRNEICERQ